MSNNQNKEDFTLVDLFRQELEKNCKEMRVRFESFRNDRSFTDLEKLAKIAGYLKGLARIAELNGFTDLCAGLHSSLINFNHIPDNRAQNLYNIIENTINLFEDVTSEPLMSLINNSSELNDKILKLNSEFDSVLIDIKNKDLSAIPLNRNLESNSKTNLSAHLNKIIDLTEHAKRKLNSAGDIYGTLSIIEMQLDELQQLQYDLFRKIEGNIEYLGIEKTIREIVDEFNQIHELLKSHIGHFEIFSIAMSDITSKLYDEAQKFKEKEKLNEIKLDDNYTIFNEDAFDKGEFAIFKLAGELYGINNRFYKGSKELNDFNSSKIISDEDNETYVKLDLAELFNLNIDKVNNKSALFIEILGKKFFIPCEVFRATLITESFPIDKSIPINPLIQSACLTEDNKVVLILNSKEIYNL